MIMFKYDDSYNRSRSIKGLAVNSEKYKNINTESTVLCTHMHFHSDFEAFCVTDGTAEFYVAGESLIIGKGSVVLINPYEAHYGIIKSPDFEYFCINFDFSYIKHPLGEKIISGKLAYENFSKNYCDALPYLKACFNSISSQSEGWAMRAVGNLMMFFSLFDSLITEKAACVEDNFAKSVISAIESAYSGQLTTQAVARRLGYNKSYFCRKFKRVFSCGFSEYLNLYRIARAKELLAEFDVSRVSEMTGFSSISYFTRVFKEHTGVTPGKYRKKLLLFTVN